MFFDIKVGLIFNGHEIEASGEVCEVELQIGLAHAYRHLNVAWHTRNFSDERYTRLSADDFNNCSVS